MDRFEEELREALRREDPPEGFARRVLARVERRERRNSWLRWPAVFHAPALRWATALAAFALAVGVYDYRRKAEQAEGERARQEVMQALRITGSKLRLAEAKVKSIVYDRQ
jgi:hypothetical protein